ncbi:hypothetical protein AB3U99_22805 [Niallia sp. JL1B1071]|uniref:hypothetical protein n=1 Tax=Niallia tiangongensis TaxID=3237105 RepID=UPI0037DDC8F2
MKRLGARPMESEVYSVCGLPTNITKRAIILNLRMNNNENLVFVKPEELPLESYFIEKKLFFPF